MFERDAGFGRPRDQMPMQSVTVTAVLFAVGLAFHFGLPVVAPAIRPQFENAALFRRRPGWASTYMALHPLWFAPVFAALYCPAQVALRGAARVAGRFRSGCSPTPPSRCRPR